MNIRPMVRPMLRPMVRAMVRGSAFDPLSLFANGEQGAWYDPSDLTTLFRDAAGIAPVTADGDPVGLMLDKSGNGNHATQSTTASKPIYRTDGTLHWLEHPADHNLATTALFTNKYGMSAATGFLFETVGGSAQLTLLGFAEGTSYNQLSVRSGIGRVGYGNRYSGGDVSAPLIVGAAGAGEAVSAVGHQDAADVNLFTQTDGGVVLSQAETQASAESQSDIPFVVGGSDFGHKWRMYGCIGLDRKFTEAETSALLEYYSREMGV